MHAEEPQRQKIRRILESCISGQECIAAASILPIRSLDFFVSSAGSNNAGTRTTNFKCQCADDARLFKNYSEDLSIKLHVRLEMQRKASAPLLEPQGIYTISIFIWQSSIFLSSHLLKYRKSATWVNHHRRIKLA